MSSVRHVDTCFITIAWKSDLAGEIGLMFVEYFVIFNLVHSFKSCQTCDLPQTDSDLRRIFLEFRRKTVNYSELERREREALDSLSESIRKTRDLARAQHNRLLGIPPPAQLECSSPVEE